ncbi:MAG: hypothetical protein AABM67_05930 [Acidobacteriota bacterium]
MRNVLQKGDSGESRKQQANLPKSSSKVQEVPLPLRDSKIMIAMVQLEGPLPHGKTIIASHGRETYEWRSLKEIKKRKAKAGLILDFLAEQHPDTNIVIFPEYSLPVREVLPLIKKKSESHNQIIIPGADNMRQRDRRVILNRCPVVIPGHEDVWITKRHPSQWESQYVDEPLDASNPVFTWEVEGRKYWIAVHICLDFTYITQDPLRDKKEPVIHLVPMCSPDNQTFRTYADTTLLEDGGRATLLCNTVGERWPGASSLYAITPTGVRLQPAYELTSNKESVVFFELDCNNLVLPKRSTKATKSPLARIHVYNLDLVGDDFSLTHLAIKPRENQERTIGVINPYLFREYAKRMLITFINVARYGSLNETDVQRQGFESYTVLGHHDMMITHLHQDPNDLFFGVRQIMGWNPSFDPTDLSSVDDGDSAKYSYFEVFTYHKVLGLKVAPAHRTAFREESPNSEELAQLLALSKDWNDENILEEVRHLFISKKWILGSTTKEPGNIDAVMTIYLDHPEELREPLQKFEDYVLPNLLDNPSITSIYEGTGRKLSINYLLRITGSKNNLFAFIQEVHQLAIEARLMIMTSTFVIVKKWSSLDLEKTLLMPVLPANEESYRNNHIVDKLSLEEKVKFIRKPREYQLNFIETFRGVENKLNALSKLMKFNQQTHDMLRDIVVGLFNEDFSVLRHPHDELQGQVESWIRDKTQATVPKNDFARIRERLGLQKGKTLDKLTYAEWLLVSIDCAEQGMIEDVSQEDLRRLLETTSHVRNAIKHDDWAKLSIRSYVAALLSYLSFLSTVKPTQKK